LTPERGEDNCDVKVRFGERIKRVAKIVRMVLFMGNERSGVE